jgi:serine/threonine-protein kinase
MIGLLGRGGMGEVYRADDVKLGQPVALKFLPADVEAEPHRLDRFLNEVRLSLRVTHPNVCRVYDVAEADGRHFLSMEYVDGEDLGSLLRRIGRLPEDKAVEIARQLCAGLEAAHAEGVLHRDLKPANVMLDGRGRARITDFGLAGATEGISGAEARAGTPQYMAPEQLSGGELTKQTDVYALGLVLYELFTGKRAYEAAQVNELLALQQSAPTSPAAHVSGLDPVVERAILRCLDPDPARRPSSAAALAAALPGGDPLAMAQAAGETPSPEMVARSGGSGALRPAVATACLAAIFVGLAAVWIGYSSFSMFSYVPLPLSPGELRSAARASIARIGYETPPVDVAYGFGYSDLETEQIAREDNSPDRWTRLTAAVPPVVYFWYRESPVELVPQNGVGRTGSFDPPMTVAGMVFVRLGPDGHLFLFQAVPPEQAADTGSVPDWSALFDLAGLDPSGFDVTAPLWTPPNVPSDRQQAWVRGEVRIEAASYRGKPVWFEIIRPSKQPDAARPTSTAQLLGASMVGTFVLGLIVGAALLARRNARLGRGNPAGALRLVIVFGAAGIIANLLTTTSSVETFVSVFYGNLARQAFLALLIWLGYMAIEPYVRRLWPHALIAWQRMLEGRLRDPLVGRHMLVGAMAGVAVSLAGLLPQAARWVGQPPPVPIAYGLDSVGGIQHFLALFFLVFQSSMIVPVMLLLGFMLLRVLLRRAWLAAVALMAVVPGALLLVGAPPVDVAVQAASFGIGLFVLTRWGLFAMLTLVVFSSWDSFPLTLDTSSWYFPWSVVTMLIFAGVAVYGFVISLGGQSLFKDPLLD